MPRFYNITPAKNKTMFDTILEFSNITREIIAQHSSHSLIAETTYILIIDPVEAMDKMFDQKRDIFASVFKGRQG